MDQETVDKINDPAKLLISWLISELWEAETLASIGDFIGIVDKLSSVVGVLKSAGLTEENMSCLDEIPESKYQHLLTEIKKWEAYETKPPEQTR